MRRRFFAALVATSAVTAIADVSVFTNTVVSASTTLLWMDDANWSPEGAPTNVANVVFEDLPTSGARISGQRIQTATDGATARRNVAAPGRAAETGRSSLCPARARTASCRRYGA